MRRVLVRERKSYSLASLAGLMRTDGNTAACVLSLLLQRGIVKRRVELAEEDDGAETASDELYQFVYVGIAIVDTWVFVSYPKYLLSNEPADRELRRFLAVVRKVGRMESKDIDTTEQGAGNLLSVMIRLLELYDESGLYTHYEVGRELNGAGQIDWARTINLRVPVIVQGSPIYAEYDTRKTSCDEADLVMRLHRAVLTECSTFLAECGILDLLAFGQVGLSSEEVENIGSPEALRWMLERERSVQFVTWKQEILDLMLLYLGGRDLAAASATVLCFGTGSFHRAWELACKCAFDDLLDTQLGALGIDLVEPWLERQKMKLIDVVPHPLWERPQDDGDWQVCEKVDSLIPDTVAFGASCKGRVFRIIDAKYYVPAVSRKITSQPGVESVTKQFLYQSAYRRFVLDHGFCAVTNSFVVPTEEPEPKILARVSFPEVLSNEKAPFSNHVCMWALPADEVFDAFLNGKQLSGARFLQV